MKISQRYAMPYKRKRQGKTDYRKRLRLLTSDRPRLVVRKSSNNIYAQIVKFDPKGDVIIAAADSKHIAKLGWKFNTKCLPCAYLVGALIAKKAKEKKISEAILDLGLYASVKGSKIYAVVKGAIDAGLKVPASAEILPSEDRIKGKHISAHRKIDDLDKNFNDVLAKIKGGK